ncbi:MAG: hypothetical protein A2V63_05460 [Candidatus Eisenbacteria bacterium RBG_19FT_COMBO_70_11]|nr:MAG: hypothetical protein A2V63_05460 [Candidatus Eisenbacteria bacterium RBG_19FT_COMBO_70_11]
MDAREGATPTDLREIARVLWRRKTLLLVPWVAAVAAGVAAAFMLQPIYFSTTRLILERAQSLPGALGGMVPGDVAAHQADVMREQVQSSLFLRSVITSTGARDDAATRAWALAKARTIPGMRPDDMVEAFLVDFLRDAITVRRLRGDIFEVTIGDLAPMRAREFARAVADQFVISSKAAQLEAVRATQEFSTEQQQVYKRKLEEVERRLEASRRALLTSTLAGSVVDGSNLARARTLLDQAGLEVQDGRRRAAALRSRIAERARGEGADPDLLSSPEAANLAAELAALERQLAQALLSATPGEDGSSVRVLLARATSDLEATLAANAARALPGLGPDARDALVRYRLGLADLDARAARRGYLAAQVAAYERQVVSAPDRELEIQRLSQDAENARSLHNSFLQQSAAAQIAEAFENAKISGRFSVLEPANLPLAPGKPNRMMLILLGLIGGAVIGVGAVLVVEQHDQSVRNADEVESLLGLPVLGAIPRLEELQRSGRRSRSAGSGVGLPAPREHGLLHRLKVESPLGLEFRRVYLKLAKTRGRSMPRTLLVTSATRGEGKTTTAACLAITLARELRERTLLVDFDLRSPALHRALGLPSSSWGLAHLLHQRHFDERYVRSTVLPQLDFLGAGRSEHPASELVDLPAVEWFLAEASARYPLVVVDAAPNLAVPDPLIIGRAVESVIYVIKAGSTVRKAAEYGVRVQREARENVIGVLINDLGEVLPQYYGYHSAYGDPAEVAGNDG